MSYIMVDVEADGPIPGDYSVKERGTILFYYACRLTTTCGEAT
jgi:hypothetical protein